MQILPYDYLDDRPANLPGLAHVARAVARLRAQSRNTLLLDNGDFLQGSPMADFFALDRGLGPDEVHPMIAAMNALGFDAGTLGNHEFNYGLDFLMRALRDAQFDLVSANLVAQIGPTPEEDTPLVRPYTLLHRDLCMGDCSTKSIVIGVIGLGPPQTVQWDSAALAGRVEARDMVEAARHWVPRMRAEGADLVIALAHTGIDAACPTGWMQENAARALAQITGIDALVLGHVHKVFPSLDFDGLDDVDLRQGTISGTPAVMSGHYGRRLGVIDLHLSHQDGWTIARTHPRTLSLGRAGRNPTGAGMPLPAGLRGTATAHAETLAHIRQTVGQSDTPLHSFFAQLGPTPAQSLIAAAQRAWFVGQPEASAHAGIPVLSAVAPFKAGGQPGPGNFTDVAKGPLTRRHMHDLYPFPNKIAALIVTGAEIKAWLEAVAGLYRPVKTGVADAMLLSADSLAYNFDMIEGLEYSFDLSAEQRLTGLAHGGRLIADADRFVVLTNSYRAAGGGGLCPILPACRHIALAQTLNRAALVQHIEQLGRVRATKSLGGWHLTAAPGSTALFDTAPAAAACLDDIAEYHPEVVGETDQGFLRLRLNF